MGRGNEQNLVQNQKRTPNERRKSAKKAGKASGVSRRKNKSIRDALKALLSGKVEYEGEQMGGNDALALSAFNKALKGDVQAFKEIRDTVGEKPKDMIELEDTRVQNIEINFVDKSKKRQIAEEDPKIIGEYTNGIDTEDSE